MTTLGSVAFILAAWLLGAVPWGVARPPPAGIERLLLAPGPPPLSAEGPNAGGPPAT